MSIFDKKEVKNKVLKLLENYNFDNSHKLFVADMVVVMKEFYPSIDLNEIYNSLSLYKGIEINKDKIQDTAHCSYPYIQDGKFTKGTICFKTEEDSKLSNFYKIEIFAHEMIHSFNLGDIKKSEKIIYEDKDEGVIKEFFGGNFSKFRELEDVFTDYYALKFTSKILSVGDYKADNIIYYDGNDKIEIPNKTPGYQFYTFYAEFLEHMYGDKIISDKFNHTEFLTDRNSKLSNLFFDLDDSLTKIKEKQSISNYKEVNQKIESLMTFYLEENNKNMNLEDYLNFRELYLNSVPIINGVNIGIQTINDFDKKYSEEFIKNTLFPVCSENVEKLKEIMEKNPEFLDKLVQSKSFNELETFARANVLINSGSINKLLEDKSYKTLKDFINIKPDCSLDIKENANFINVPEDIKKLVNDAASYFEENLEINKDTNKKENTIVKENEVFSL